MMVVSKLFDFKKSLKKSDFEKRCENISRITYKIIRKTPFIDDNQSWHSFLSYAVGKLSLMKRCVTVIEEIMLPRIAKIKIICLKFSK